MKKKSFIEQWLCYQFSTGSETGQDYKNFEKQARKDLSVRAKAAGYTLVKFNNNHYCFSAVLRRVESGAYVYISISDVRFWPDEWYSHVLYRTMRHATDWTGGMNHYCMWDELEEVLTAPRFINEQASCLST